MVTYQISFQITLLTTLCRLNTVLRLLSCSILARNVDGAGSPASRAALRESSIEHTALSWSRRWPLIPIAEWIGLWHVHFVSRARRSRVKALIGHLRKKHNSVLHNALKVEIDLPQGIHVAEDRARFLSLQSHRLAAASEASQMSDLDNLVIDSDAAAPTQAAAVDLEEARHRLLFESFEAVLVADAGDDSEEEQSAPGTVTRRSQAISPEAVGPA